MRLAIHLYTPTTTDDYYLLVATSYTDLWDGTIASGITYGDGNTSYHVWTGSNNDGTTRNPPADGAYLGSGPNGDGTSNIAGSTPINGAGWLNPWSNGDTTTQHMMGMSGVITPGGGATPGTLIYGK